jgi:hypothetical protein
MHVVTELQQHKKLNAKMHVLNQVYLQILTKY